MKTWFFAFFMCWGMFLSLPCPFPKWDENARGKMLVCFPLIGAIVGAVWAGAAALIKLVGCPAPFAAFIMTALPIALTGGIHLDGFMDVCDALFSRRGLEESRRILKDPHIGAFAVISAILLLIGVYSLFFCRMLEGRELAALAAIPVCVRAAAGVMVKVLRPMETSQYAAGQEKPKAGHIAALSIMLAAGLAFAFKLSGYKAAAPAAGAAAYVVFALIAYAKLKGMNGDISGFGLVLGEAVGAAVLLLWA